MSLIGNRKNKWALFKPACVCVRVSVSLHAHVCTRARTHTHMKAMCGAVATGSCSDIEPPTCKFGSNIY